MNVEKFKKDLDDNIYKTQVEDDIKLGYKIGVNATPTFILDNVVMDFGNINDFEDHKLLQLLQMQAVMHKSSF
jgi:protein-disulfide isomerase